jgi:hypothetical protein
VTKRSKFEQAQRADEDARMRDIGDAWMARLSPADATAFRSAVSEAWSRPRAERQPDMAPGTRPNPPRPGREPKPVEPAGGRRSSRY